VAGSHTSRTRWLAAARFKAAGGRTREPRRGTSIATLEQSGHAKAFLKDQYRHCKPIVLTGEAERLLVAAGIPPALSDGEADPGLLVHADDTAAATSAFIAALTKHRHFERETDPPRV
jgi:catalase